MYITVGEAQERSREGIGDENGQDLPVATVTLTHVGT